MLCSLIPLEGKGNESRLRENRVHIGGLPGNSIVFLFYYLRYSGYTKRETEVSNKETKRAVRIYILISMAKIRDKNYSKIIDNFGVEHLRVLVITGRDTKEASKTKDRDCTAFVRIDRKSLLKDAEKKVDVVVKIINLFHSGSIFEKHAKYAECLSMLFALKNAMLDMLKNIEETSFGFIDDSFRIKFRGR